MSTGYVIEWFEGCWLSKGKGDPCRTLVFENAQVFKTIPAARRRLTTDSKKYPYRDFTNSKILKLNPPRKISFTVNLK